MKRMTLRAVLAAALVLVMGAAVGFVMAHKTPTIYASNGAVYLDEDQTVYGEGATAADSESVPYAERLSEFRWNTKTSDKSRWPSVLFRKEMNDDAKQFARLYFSKGNAKGSWSSMVTGYNARDTLDAFADTFQYSNVAQIKLKRIGYASGRYQVIYGGTSKGPNTFFTVSMRGMQPDRWSITDFTITQE